MISVRKSHVSVGYEYLYHVYRLVGQSHVSSLQNNEMKFLHVLSDQNF